MNDERNNPSSKEITSPRLSTNSAEMWNSFNSLENSTPDSLALTCQDRVNFHSRWITKYNCYWTKQ